MSTKNEVNFTFQRRGKGIRKNLTTYFTVRLLQGFILAILFHLFLNATGERSLDWKFLIMTFPMCSILGTMFFESVRVIVEERVIRVIKEEQVKFKK